MIAQCSALPTAQMNGYFQRIPPEQHYCDCPLIELNTPVHTFMPKIYSIEG